MNPVQRIRSFIAIPLPEEIHHRLAEFQTSLKKYHADISWVKPENIHLTLQFLGEIEPNLVEKVERCLAEIVPTQSVFPFEIAGTGVFPNPQKARVLWVGVTQGKEQIVQLQSAIEKSLRKLDIRAEERKFHPHLTLGRVRSSKNLDAVVTELLNHNNVSFGTVAVTEVILFSSQLSPSGAIYTPLKNVQCHSSNAK
ncbi:MAG: RNA 2',3'-cyclic phosphodiesterase [bacterium]|nr:RNA 2',3'-cyclic phosphodiesterase [bacterium]